MLQTIKTLPASHVQNNFGAIARHVWEGKYTEVIVENRGKPIVAIVDIEDLQIIREFREQKKRKKALAMLRDARDTIQAQIKGKLTSAQVKTIANRFSRELVEDMEKEGKIHFERKTA